MKNRPAVPSHGPGGEKNPTPPNGIENLMAKCGHCGAGIEGNEISYRDASKGGYRSRSVRLCYNCTSKYDTAEAGQKLFKTVAIAIVSVVVVGAFLYLLFHR